MHKLNKTLNIFEKTLDVWKTLWYNTNRRETAPRFMRLSSLQKFRHESNRYPQKATVTFHFYRIYQNSVLLFELSALQIKVLLCKSCNHLLSSYFINRWLRRRENNRINRSVMLSETIIAYVYSDVKQNSTSYPLRYSIGGGMFD